MKKWIIIEIVLFIIMVVLVIKFNCYKTALVYLLFCESLNSINKIMIRYLKQLKKTNAIYEQQLNIIMGKKK